MPTPGYTYFKEKFDGELRPIVNCFRAARMISPVKMSEMQVGNLNVDDLSSFPFLRDQALISNLKSELNTYVAAVEDIDPEIDVLQWWKNHREQLPQWSAVAKSICLVQPSSAASERVFSLLSNSFSSQQTGGLTSLML